MSKRKIDDDNTTDEGEPATKAGKNGKSISF